MLVGDVIRKYRKQVGITQEEMARRLGVTTPAVNKWENNNTQPDIALLAPIARLLGITTDTLLSFRDSLSSEEIAAFVKKLDQDLETREYAEDFKIALHVYEPELADVLVPNCIYRNGCPEFQTCGYWKKFMKWLETVTFDDEHRMEVLMDISRRYEHYNLFFNEEINGGECGSCEI